jgi:hypothetical protein
MPPGHATCRGKATHLGSGPHAQAPVPIIQAAHEPRTHVTRDQPRAARDLPLTRRCAAPPAPFEAPTAWKRRRVHLQAHSTSAPARHRARATLHERGPPETTTLNVIELHPKSPLLLTNLKRDVSARAGLRAGALRSHAGAASECRTRQADGQRGIIACGEWRVTWRRHAEAAA